MPQTVHLKDLNIDLEFPDGMSDEAIASAIKRNLPKLRAQGGSATPASPSPVGAAPDVFAGQKYLAGQADAASGGGNATTALPPQPVVPNPTATATGFLTKRNQNVPYKGALPVGPITPGPTLAEAKGPNFLQAAGEELQGVAGILGKPFEWLSNLGIVDPETAMSELDRGKSIDEVMKGHSLAELDRATDMTPAIQGLDLQKRYGNLGGVGQGIIQTANNLLKPSNLMLAGALGPLGEMGAAPKAAVGLGFGVPMVAGGAGTALHGLGSGDTAQTTEGLLTAGLGGIAGSHGLHEAGRILENLPTPLTSRMNIPDQTGSLARGLGPQTEGALIESPQQPVVKQEAPQTTPVDKSLIDGKDPDVLRNDQYVRDLTSKGWVIRGEKGPIKLLSKGREGKYIDTNGNFDERTHYPTLVKKFKAAPEYVAPEVQSNAVPINSAEGQIGGVGEAGQNGAIRLRQAGAGEQGVAPAATPNTATAQQTFRTSQEWQDEIDRLETELERGGEDPVTNPPVVWTRNGFGPADPNNPTHNKLSEAYNMRERNYNTEDEQALGEVKFSPNTVSGPLPEADLRTALRETLKTTQYGTGAGLHTPEEIMRTLFRRMVNKAYQTGVLDSREIDSIEDFTHPGVRNGKEFVKQWESAANDLGLSGTEKVVSGGSDRRMEPARSVPTTPLSTENIFGEESAAQSPEVEPPVRNSDSSPTERILKNPPPEPSGDTTGIAQRITGAASGEGQAVGEALERGKARIAAGEDPVRHLTMMQERGAYADSEDIGLLHAHRNALRVAEDAAYDKLKAKPTDATLRKAYEDAHSEVSLWDKAVKPFQTEASNVFRAMQGDTDINTGSFTSVRHAFEDRAGRSMTPTEERTATQHVERVSELEAQVSDLQAKVDEALRKQMERRGTKSTGKLPTEVDALREHFQKRIEDGSLFRQTTVKAPEGSHSGAVNASTAPNFTPQEVAAIWNHAKTYIDRGVKFGDMVSGVASDLGLETEWVYKALAVDKATRTVTDAMYRKMSDRRSAVNAAKLFVETANMPGYQKVWRNITAFPRSVAVFGHGGVGMVTHAGPNIFRPSMFTAYWRNFFRQVPYTANKAFHERMMSNLEADSNFIKWKRAGLAVDPNKIYDDYQAYGKVVGAAGKAGNRGMDALKTFRLEAANQIWEGLPDNIKKEADAPQLIAEWINHATGSGSLGHGAIADIASEALFAGSLEASRWARVLGDPIKTARVLTVDRATSTPAEKYVAWLRVRKAAELAATYTALLAANYGLNASMRMRPEDNVNFTDPTKSDWMLFKFAGKAIDATGNALAPLKYMSSLAATSTGMQPTYQGQSKWEQAVSDTAFYGRGKLAPQYGIGVDVASQRDIMGRPLPFTTAKETASKPAYEPLEYGLEHGPIPFAAGTQEFYKALRERGFSDSLSSSIIKGVVTGGIELTGVKLKEPPKDRPAK